LALKVVFGKLLPVPKLCKNIFAQCASVMTGTVCYDQKLLFVMQNLRIWGIMATGGSKYVAESAIFGIADPDLHIHYATFMGLQ